MLDRIRADIERFHPDRNRGRNPQEMIAAVDTTLAVIKDLESERGNFPFFKSSVQDETEMLEEYKTEYLRIINSRIPENIKNFYLKYRYDEVPIVGTKSVEPIPKITLELMDSDEIGFISEKEPDDTGKRIAVYIDKQKYGYIDQNSPIKRMILDAQKANEPIYARISGVRPAEELITLLIAFYKDPIKETGLAESIRTKLIGTSKETARKNIRQDNINHAIEILKHNTILSLRYNNKESSYNVSIRSKGIEIGQLSKEVSKLILEKQGEYDIVSCVDRVIKDANGKLHVFIQVYFT